MFMYIIYIYINASPPPPRDLPFLAIYMVKSTAHFNCAVSSSDTIKFNSHFN